MTRLRAADLEAVLSFLGEAQTVDGPAPFTPELLDRLIEIVGCEYASFSEVDDPMRVNAPLHQILGRTAGAGRRRLVGKPQNGRASSVPVRERRETGNRAR